MPTATADDDRPECPWCNGSGLDEDDDELQTDCTFCHGSGYEPEDDGFEVVDDDGELD